MKTRSLPLLDQNLERRSVLLVGVAAASVAACGPESSQPTPTSDVPATDTGSPPTDTGADAGTPTDTGVMQPTDSGMMPPTDTGMMPPTDSGMMPADSGMMVTCPADGTRMGPVSEVAAGSWRLYSMQRVVVARDAGGLFAYTAVCTHNGCTIGAPDAMGNSTCPCHGSRYDGSGAVTGGPASRALVHYEVVVCNGDIYVRTMREVATTARTPV
jgi:Rieske Fe-S protein